MDKLEQNLSIKKKQVEDHYNLFNADTMSHKDFDEWVGKLVKEMYGYQLMRFNPKAKE